MNHLLTFELPKEKNCLDIHLDNEGIDILIDSLQKLKRTTQEHEHLMVPSWGGKLLSEELQSDDGTLVKKVTLHKWNSDTEKLT